MLRDMSQHRISIAAVTHISRLRPAGKPDGQTRETRMPLRHRFLEPIHNVKEGSRQASVTGPLGPELMIFILDVLGRSSLRSRCAVSRSKAAPYGALSGAGRTRSRAK